MRKVKKKHIGSKAVATKGDLEQLREDIHVDITTHTVSKQEFEARMGQLVTKDEFEQRMSTVSTKKDLEGLEDRVVNRIQAAWEQREADLQEVHEDQLDIIVGKKEAPSQWKTVPRRLKNVETQVEKIKDRLATA